MRMKEKVVRPGGLELPTFWFVARRSIQLSYGRADTLFTFNSLTQFLARFQPRVFPHSEFERYFLRTKHSAKLSTAAAESCVERLGADR